MAAREHQDEAHLLADSARGDGVAFGVIYRRYLPIVVRWCWVQTGDRELAADLSAEVFAAALQSARRYRPEQGPPVAWLLGIARHKLREAVLGRVVEDRPYRELAAELHCSESVVRKRVSRGLHTL